jgi:hypothetical protein
MTFTFTIPGSLPSLNQTLKIPKYRFSQARKRREVKYHVGSWIMASRIPKFSGPVKIHMHWIEKSRRKDRDNIRSGAKPILDQLVLQERIVNDSMKWLVDLTDSYGLDPKNPRIEVTITDAPAEMSPILSNEPGRREGSRL